MKNVSLKFKLFALSGSLLFLSFILGAVGYWALKAVQKDYQNIVNVLVVNADNVNEMNLATRQVRIQILQLTMDGTSTEDDLHSIKDIKEQFETVKRLKDSYLSVPFLEGEEPLWNKYWASFETFEGKIGTALEMYEKSEPGTPERQAMQTFVVQGLRDTAREMRANVRELRKFLNDAKDEGVRNAESIASLATMISLLTLAVGVLAGMAVAYIFSTSLVKTLRCITDSIADSSSQVSAAAGQIASSSEELSQAATEQASSLEETAASIEEMNSMVSKNRDNAKNAASVSGESEASATRGREAVEQMISAMGEINQSNEQIAEIVKVINEIGNKTKVINDIVFQTKLLSFNASVEAARAGEHGKGFAVVAEEVGNLAQMSGNAAKEISTLLESSVHKVETIVNETKSKVESGTMTAQRCGEILSEIVSAVSQVAGMASEISTASEEQARGVQEITRAMTQLDQVTQTNAATSEEAASAAEELSAQADMLRSLVADLTVTVNGRPSDASLAGKAPVKAPAPSKAASKEAAPAAGGKLVHLKAKPGSEPVAAPVFKKASGDDAPAYDDSRFKDV